MFLCWFYGGWGRSGFVHSLPVIQVGFRKRGVRKSDLMRALAERTTSPRHIAA
jgi:hypothetical protein